MNFPSRLWHGLSWHNKKEITEGQSSIPEPVDALLESGLDVGGLCAGEQQRHEVQRQEEDCAQRTEPGKQRR